MQSVEMIQKAMGWGWHAGTCFSQLLVALTYQGQLLDEDQRGLIQHGKGRWDLTGLEYLELGRYDAFDLSYLCLGSC